MENEKIVTALNLSPRNSGLIRFLATGAVVTASEILEPSPNDQTVIHAIQYTDNIIDGALEGKWKYTVLPESFTDIERLPEISGFTPIQPAGDIPSQMGLAVARAGFAVIESMPTATAQDVEKRIVRECCSALGFYIGVAHGIQIEPDGICCGFIGESIQNALNGENSIADINKAMSTFAAPGGEAGSLHPDLEKSPVSYTLALCTVKALIAARSALGEEFKVALSVYDGTFPPRSDAANGPQSKCPYRTKTPRRAPGG